MKDYQISRKQETDAFVKLLESNGQVLLPMVELIEDAQLAVDDLLERLGISTLEAVLRISAAKVAGDSHQGKRGGEIVRHGVQPCIIPLGNRKVRVDRPRLRHKAGGAGAERDIPAYVKMQEDHRFPGKVLDTLMRCVSTRNYEGILPEACEAVGVSKSSISREFVEASEEEYRKLLERSFEKTDILVIYIDGIQFGEHHIIAAIGIDALGYKHVLGIVQGATENSAVVIALLESLVERGINPGVKRLFVIDGSKALRKAICMVYGEDNPVQRCRIHKVRNVMAHLPEDEKAYARLTMRAAFVLDPKAGMKRLEDLALIYEKRYPSAAASVREGLSEMFTVTHLGLPKGLSRSLVSTNIIESPNAGVRLRTRRVTRWKDGAMTLRWAASAFVTSEKRFNRLFGCNHLWILKAALGYKDVDTSQAA